MLRSPHYFHDAKCLFPKGQTTTEITKFSKDIHNIIVGRIRNARFRGRNLLNYV